MVYIVNKSGIVGDRDGKHENRNSKIKNANGTAKNDCAIRIFCVIEE